MYCAQCGKSVEDDARFCPSCGARLDRQEQPREGASAPPDSPRHTSADDQAHSQPPYGGGPIPHVKNYLVESILCTICCCLPFGIPGIIFAAQVDRYLKEGDISGAREASSKAKKWTLVAFVVGIVLWISMILLTTANVFTISEYFNQSDWY